MERRKEEKENGGRDGGRNYRWNKGRKKEKDEERKNKGEINNRGQRNV